MYIITFQCYHCGIIVKALVRNKRISFSIMDKQHSKEQCLTDNGYFKCVHCHKITSRIKFEKVYS